MLDLSKPNHTQPNFNVQSYVIYALRLRWAVRTTLCPVFKCGIFCEDFMRGAKFSSNECKLDCKASTILRQKKLTTYFARPLDSD